MPYQVVNLPRLASITSSGGAGVTNAIGNLDDASSITIFFVSTGNPVFGTVQVAQFDPALVGYTGTSFAGSVNPSGVAQSSNWSVYTPATAFAATSSGASITLKDISFRGLRLTLTVSSSFGGEVVAYATKQISV